MVEETCKVLGIKPKELIERATNGETFQDALVERYLGYLNRGIVHPVVKAFCERTLNAEQERSQSIAS